MASQDEPGPVCLYKDGVAKVFQPGEVAGDGWLDNPNGIVETIAPTPAEDAAKEAERRESDLKLQVEIAELEKVEAEARAVIAEKNAEDLRDVAAKAEAAKHEPIEPEIVEGIPETVQIPMEDQDKKKKPK